MNPKNPKLHFYFLTLFPDTIDVWLKTSILGRAFEKGLFGYDLVQLRDYANDKHRSVDDVAYGGGGGMVLKVEPLVVAVEKIQETAPEAEVVYFSPTGRRIDQTLITEMAPRPDFGRAYILVCGHYEGVDQRFIDGWVDREISLGDFVLTGGELPAVALADALIRQIDGALGHEGGSRKESFSLREPELGHPLLEYPHYTRPPNFRGMAVPAILRGGNHEKVARWRMNASVIRTRRTRPDLIG